MNFIICKIRVRCKDWLKIIIDFIIILDFFESGLLCLNEA